MARQTRSRTSTQGAGSGVGSARAPGASGARATRARLAESARRRSPYFRARSLPLRFLAVNAIRIRWEILRACIF